MLSLRALRSYVYFSKFTFFQRRTIYIDFVEKFLLFWELLSRIFIRANAEF